VIYDNMPNIDLNFGVQSYCLIFFLEAPEVGLNSLCVTWIGEQQSIQFQTVKSVASTFDIGDKNHQFLLIFLISSYLM